MAWNVGGEQRNVTHPGKEEGGGRGGFGGGRINILGGNPVSHRLVIPSHTCALPTTCCAHVSGSCSSPLPSPLSIAPFPPFQLDLLPPFEICLFLLFLFFLLFFSSDRSVSALLIKLVPYRSRMKNMFSFIIDR